jgi:serine/threonine protein kinase
MALWRVLLFSMPTTSFTATSNPKTFVALGASLFLFFEQKNICRQILVTELGEIKLTDFGVSLLVNDCAAGSDEMPSSPSSLPPGGTALYLAPELFTPGAAASVAADLWAVGVTAATLCLGEHPLAHMRGMAARTAIQTTFAPTLAGKTATGTWSRGLQAAVAAMGARDPAQRPAAATLLHDSKCFTVHSPNPLKKRVKRFLV